MQARTRIRGRPAALALLVALTVCAAGCGKRTTANERLPPGPARFQLTILDLAPLSGDLAPLGQSGRKAADLAAAEIRAAIESNGLDQNVTVVHADDRSDPRVGVEAARRTLDQHRSTCIVGSWSPAVTTAVATQVAIPRATLQITPASTTDEISKLDDHGLVNRTVMPDSYQGQALAQSIENDLGGAGGLTVNIAAETNSYGKGLAAAFTNDWKRRGGSIGKLVEFGPKQKSYTVQAGQLVAGRPDAFVIFSFASAYANLSKALVANGAWGADRTYGTDALAIQNLPKIAGSDATEGLRGTAPGTPQTSPAALAFDRLYASRRGPAAQTFAAQTFDAVILCYLSAIQAGKAEGQAMADSVREVSAPPGKVYAWPKLPAAIEEIEFEGGIDYQGASGPIDMNSAGDATAGSYDLFRFRNGRLEVYDEVPVGRPTAG